MSESFDTFRAEDFFDFKCPYCQRTVSYPPGAIGQTVECLQCPEVFIVPAAGSDVGRPLPIPIVTPRLTLRRLHSTDWADLVEILSDDELIGHMDRWRMDEKGIKEWLDADADIRFGAPDKTFSLAVERKDIARVIGFVGLTVDAPRELATVNIVIGRLHQRQGFGTEVLRALLGFCLKEVALHRVLAPCDARNDAGARLMQKAGMRFEARFLDDERDGDGWADTVWFALLAREYLNGPPAAPAGR